MGKEPSKFDLVEAEYPSIVLSTVPQMIDAILLFAKAESTTANDLLVAAKAVDLVQKLSNDDTAKLVTARELGSLGVQAFTGNFKVQILRGLVAAPKSERDSLPDIKATAEKLFQELKARRDRLAAIVFKISNRG